MWYLEDHEREALAKASTNEFRVKVIDHALSKLNFADENIPEDHLYEIAEKLFDLSHEFLKNYPEAAYKSYVFMVMLYFIKGVDEMHKPYIQDTLRNDRIGINTRVKCIYDITRIVFERKL